MARLYCRCGAVDVTSSDSAEHSGGYLVVHALAGCYTTPSLFRASPSQAPSRHE